MVRKSVVMVLAAALMLTGCVPIKRMSTKQIGRDGWELAGVKENIEINVVRGAGESVWIKLIPNDPHHFVVKVTPPDRTMEVPPWVKLERTEACGMAHIYECRFYAIPEGKAFHDVYDWQMKWFEFRYK